MARPVAKVLAWFAGVGAVLVLGAVLLALRQPLRPAAPLPNPNGYDELVKAGRTFAGNAWDFPTLEENTLRSILATNAEALSLARTGLTHSCQVPPVVSSETNTSWVEELTAMKVLARVFAAEGRLAELQGRTGDAGESYLQAVQVGCALSRGGTIILSLVDIACEGIGLASLEKLVPSLDAKHCRELAAGLQATDARRASATDTLAAERDWVRRNYGLKGQFMRLVTYRSIRATEKNWASKLAAHELRVRRLMVDLAARAYELEKGERPKDLTALVPLYLKAIPQDPLTGTNVAFRK